MPSGLDTSLTEYREDMAQISGANYEFNAGNPINDQKDEFGIVCSLCQLKAGQHTAYMIPGTNTCPAGSLPEYTGYIMATDSASDSGAGTEYICVSDAFDTGANTGVPDGARVGVVQTNCAASAALPCEDYDDHNVLSCVVCSN